MCSVIIEEQGLFRFETGPVAFCKTSRIIKLSESTLIIHYEVCDLEIDDTNKEILRLLCKFRLIGAPFSVAPVQAFRINGL